MFKGLGNLGNIAGMIKQAQEMGPKMQEAQEKLKLKSVSGTAGGGMVTVHADGLGTVTKVEIDPVLIEKNDFEMVMDLLPAAINQASAKAKELHVEEMKSVTGDLPLPGGLEDTLKNFLSPGQ
jgi:DNA-binding YbaB/EbfC family protein